MKILSLALASSLLLRQAFRPYRWHIVAMAVLSFFSGALEGVGITAIIPLLSFIGAGEKAADNISLAIAHFFGYMNLPYTAKFLLLFMIILFFLKVAFLLFSQQISARVISDFEKKTRESLLQLTLAAKWPFLSSQKVGHLDQMLSTEVSNSSAILLYISNAILVLVNLLIYSVLVFNISPTVAMLTIISGGTIFFVFLPLFQKTRALSERMVRENKELAHFSSEHIIGAKTIKSMHLEDLAFLRGRKLSDMMRHLYLKLLFVKNSTAALLQLAGVFFVVGLFVFLYKTSAFEFAAFAVVVYALNRVFSNVQFAQSSAHAISMQIPYLASIMRYQDEAVKNQESEQGTEHFLFERELLFRNVDFTYLGNDPTLSAVTFSVKKGDIVGIVGPSGSGKTTLVDLLLRLISPRGGVILLDGKDSRKVSLTEWRRSIGYVSQDVFLLNGSIEENIKFYDETISDEVMCDAAKAANIYDFIAEQPLQFKTPVGERGLSLSGGQRQRIALARVLARKPQILILDEATSALDTESEILVQKAIVGFKGRVTVFAIAHRLSTVKDSDKLIVLQDGKIIEEGAPDDLLRDVHSSFFKMHRINR